MPVTLLEGSAANPVRISPVSMPERLAGSLEIYSATMARAAGVHMRASPPQTQPAANWLNMCYHDLKSRDLIR